MDPEEEDITVLVVDDEPGIVDLYSHMLRPEYEVWTANSGKQALDIINGEVDIVFLDRRMPGMTGDEVLRKIREREIECQVAMLTAVEPDYDIIEMGFDDYLVKPVTRELLFDTVEALLSRSEYEDNLQEYYSLISKKSTLEAKKDMDELHDSDEYAELQEKIKEARERVDQRLDEVTESGDFTAAFRDVAQSGN